MSFCTNCGAKLQEHEVYCYNCGFKVIDDEEKRNEYGYQNPNSYPNQNVYPYPNTNVNGYYYANNKKGKKIGVVIGLALVAFIAILAIMIPLIAFRTPSYEKPLKNLTKALENGNYDKLLNCYPEYYRDVIADSLDYYGDSDDAMDELMDQFEESCGDGIKITYKIKDKEKIIRDELSSMEDSIKKEYDEDVTIQDGYKLKVKINIEGDDDIEAGVADFNVIKIDSKWYLTDSFMEW